ncbi:MAG: UDP-N-acetylmuramate dehydrogenase [Anaerotignum sp.]|nr:UDP-N-acetylmuramate dehydrogenase [Anaerotignum sp.]
MEKAIEKLCGVLGSDAVRLEEPMKAHTSFRIGGPAELFLTPENAAQLAEAIRILRRHEIPVFILGNGSNLLVRDKGIRGAVVQLSGRMSALETDGTALYAEGGALLSAAAAKAAKAGLTGLEFASGIPGSIGGAVMMNAGAYGGEMKDVLESVDVLTRDLRQETLPVEQIGLSYRHSGLAERGDIVLGVRFRLGQGDPQAIQARMAELAEQRREKQPLQYPSAGSTFKRPEGYFAGKLIQDAGLKGKTIGGAQVSEKHAGFLINTGNATAGEMLELIAFCQRTVEEKFGVRLETEVRIVGEE